MEMGTLNSDARWYREIMQRDRGLCRYCGAVATSLDHLVPYNKKGANSAQNLVASCTGCNSVLGAKSFASFKEKKEYIAAVRTLATMRPSPFAADLIHTGLSLFALAEKLGYKWKRVYTLMRGRLPQFRVVQETERRLLSRAPEIYSMYLRLGWVKGTDSAEHHFKNIKQRYSLMRQMQMLVNRRLTSRRFGRRVDKRPAASATRRLSGGGKADARR
jgi:hypothetical protein